MQPEQYHTIDSICSAEFKDRGSRFIAIAIPVETIEDIQHQITLVKNQHPKAVHHCYAYRLGIDKNNWRANDDGEPSGSAGKPILGQIDSFGLTQLLIIVVRYFGGTLLGVSGLINAYKTSSKMVLEQAQIVHRTLLTHYYIQTSYKSQFAIIKWLKQKNILFKVQNNIDMVTMKISIPFNLAELFEAEAGDFTIIEKR